MYTPFETINPYDVHFVTKMCHALSPPPFVFATRSRPAPRRRVGRERSRVAHARARGRDERAPGGIHERCDASAMHRVRPRRTGAGALWPRPRAYRRRCCFDRPDRSIPSSLDRRSSSTACDRNRRLGQARAVCFETSRPNSASRIVSEVRLSPWERRSCFTPLPSARCSGCVGQERRDG